MILYISVFVPVSYCLDDCGFVVEPEVMDNLEEMDKFLEKCNFPKLNQEEIENLNRPITSMEIETVSRNLLANKSPGPDGFTAEFYQKFREELTPILLKLSRKLQRKVNFQTHSMRPPSP